MITVTAAVLSEPQTYTTDDDSIQIDVKYKQVKTNKITFNANGGKIGSKTAVSINVNKGSKIKKFPSTPKRTGYTFKGWYTKRSGGSKISVNTKPSKKVILYAHWAKKGSASANSNIDQKLIGAWEYKFIGLHGTDSYNYFFYRDGKAKFFETFGTSNLRKEAKFTTSKGKIYLTNVYSVNAIGNKDKTSDKVVDYLIGKDNKGEYLNIGNIMGVGDYSEKTPMKFRK